MAINVLLTRKFFEGDIGYIKNGLKEGCNIIDPGAYTEDDLLKYAEDVDIMFGPVISKKVCEAAKHLKFIQIPWNGVDNLNFDLIREIGVKVCNSHSNAAPVAELAVAMMLDAAKKIAYHDRMMRDGEWNRPKPDKSNVVSPFSKKIAGSKVAIIGFGHIGKLIKQYLSGFCCEFLLADVFFKVDTKVEGASCFTMDKLAQVLEQADFVFLCLPLLDSTLCFFGKEQFDSMKDGAILINTSRGEIVNPGDLFEALSEKRIGGAAFDTWWNNPKNPFEKAKSSLDYPFEILDNLLMSPQRAGMVEGELPHLDDAIMNINLTIDGLEPLNVVSVENKF